MNVTQVIAAMTQNGFCLHLSQSTADEVLLQLDAFDPGRLVRREPVPDCGRRVSHTLAS